MSDDPITYGTQTGDGFYCVPGGKPLTTAPEQYGWPTDAVLAVQAAEERAEALRAALEKIPASGLEVLASWFDMHDDKRGYTGDREVQMDLRRWSKTISGALAADDAARGGS